MSNIMAAVLLTLAQSTDMSLVNEVSNPKMMSSNFSLSAINKKEQEIFHFENVNPRKC